MVTVHGFLQVMLIVCAPSFIFVAWMIWRAPEAEHKVANADDPGSVADA
jgi:hypothetical protein